MREELIKISKTEWDTAKGHFNNDPDAVEFLPNQAGTDKKKSTFSFRKKDGKIYALANQYCFDSRGTSLKLMLPDKGSIKKVRLMQRESGENYALVVMEDNKRLIMPVEEFQKSIYVPANHVLNDAKVLLKYILNVPPFLKGGECKINISDDQFNTIDKIVSLRPPEDGYLLINEQDRAVLDQALLILDPLHHKSPSTTFQEGSRPSDEIDDILDEIDQFLYEKSDTGKDTQEKIVEQARQPEAMLNAPAKAVEPVEPVEPVDPVDAEYALDILLTVLEPKLNDDEIKIVEGEDLTNEELDVIESTLNVKLQKKDGYLIIDDDIIDRIENKMIELRAQSQDIRSVTAWKPAYPRKRSDIVANEIEEKISKEIEEELAKKISKEMEEDLAKNNIDLTPFEIFEKTRNEIDKKLKVGEIKRIDKKLQEENIVVSALRGLDRGLDYSIHEKAEIKLKHASDEEFFPMPIDPELVKQRETVEKLLDDIEKDMDKTRDLPPRSDVKIKDKDLTFSNTKNKETHTPIKETSRSVQHAQDIIKSLIPPKPVFPPIGDGVINILNDLIEKPLRTQYDDKRTTKGKLLTTFQDINISVGNVSKKRNKQINDINKTIEKLKMEEKLNPHEKGVILYGILEQVKIETSKDHLFKSRLNEICTELQKKLKDEGKITPPEDPQLAIQLYTEFDSSVEGFKQYVKDHQEELKAKKKDLKI